MNISRKLFIGKRQRAVRTANDIEVFVYKIGRARFGVVAMAQHV